MVEPRNPLNLDLGNRHDFDDGNGLVEAHRHINPDHTYGGWVANTASVEYKAYVGPNASVYGYAVVEAGARIEDTSRVCDQARIKRFARIYGNTDLAGQTTVEPGVRVRCETEILDRISINDDLLMLDISESKSVGSYFPLLILVKHGDSELVQRVGYDTIPEGVSFTVLETNSAPIPTTIGKAFEEGIIRGYRAGLKHGAKK